jgi:hypothetical protein
MMAVCNDGNLDLAFQIIAYKAAAIPSIRQFLIFLSDFFLQENGSGFYQPVLNGKSR